MSARLAALFFGLAASVPLSAQTTWTVDRLNRAGTDFLDLQPAVDAAASGDVIRVRAAGAPIAFGPSYLAPVIDGKSLTILGEGSDDGPLSTWMRGLLWVRNLRPAEVVRVADVVIWQVAGAIGPPGSGMRLEANQGTVLLERTRIEAIGTAPSPVIESCALVILRNVRYLAKPAGLAVLRSNAVLQSCQFDSVTVGAFLQGPFGAIDSRLWVHHTTVIAGNAPSATVTGMPGISAAGSEIFLGPGTHLQGGTGPGGRNSAVQASLTQEGRYVTVHVDPGVTWLGTIEGDLDFGPVTTLRATTTATTLTLDHSCTPQALVLLTAGPLLATPWNAPEGLLAIDPLPDFACVAFAPSSGQLQWTFPMPPGLPVDFVIGLQGGELRPNGTVRLTDVVTVSGS